MASRVFAVMTPHPPIMVAEVGGPRAEVTAASVQAARRAAEMLAAFAPDTVVIMSPHAPGVRDAFAVETSAHVAGSLARFGAPDVEIDTVVDEEMAAAILEEADATGIPTVERPSLPPLAPGELDHGVLVPMRFLDPASRHPLVVLSLSALPLADHGALGAAIRRAAERLGRRMAFVASGDLSHRLTPEAPAGYSPLAGSFDEKIVAVVRGGDLSMLLKIDPVLAEDAGECGLRSLATLAGILPQADTRVLAYEGPWGVGYMTAVAAPPGDLAGIEERVTPDAGAARGEPGGAEGPLPALARRAIEAYVLDGGILEPDPTADPVLATPAGVFVSLHIHEQLRGCIGTICPTTADVAHEIVRNAVEAATGDPRFPPVVPEELPHLQVKVDVLHTSEACAVEDLDPKRYGVIVSCGWRRGLLLPDLEGVELTEDQVAIARRKAGIADHEPIVLERFKVDRFE